MKLVMITDTDAHRYIYPHLLVFLNGKDITKDYYIVKADESLGIIHHIPNLETGVEQLLRGKVEIKLKPGVANEIKVLFRYIRNYGLLTDDQTGKIDHKRKAGEKVSTGHASQAHNKKSRTSKKDGQGHKEKRSG